MIPPETGTNASLCMRRKLLHLRREAEKMLVKNYPELAAAFSLQLNRMMDTIIDHDSSKSIIIMVSSEVNKIHYLNIKFQQKVLVANHWCTWCWIQPGSSPVKMTLLKGSIIYQLPACSFTQPLLALN
jgi:hypothetical protein